MSKLRRFAPVVALATVITLGAACTPPPYIYPGPPTANWQYKTTSFHVNEEQDCVLICSLYSDEPYSLNIAFRVKVGQDGSAATWVVEGDSGSDVDAGETYNTSGGQQATTQFPAVNMVDVLDLAFGAKLEIAGMWTWAMEEDWIGVNGAATTVAGLMLTALDVVESATLPSDTSQIVSMLLGSLGFGGVLSILGTTLLGVTGLQDDAVGSRLYIGLGVTGTLGATIDATANSVTFPALALPVISIPPDIEGGRLFRLGALPSWTDNFNQPGDGDYDVSFSASTY